MAEFSVQQFNDRLVETQSGADEVQDFALKASYAFPSADVLIPAPMAVSILGQLTLVATATDFKLAQPIDGTFRRIRYPDSFRATITQLVNEGCLALNASFANFDEIRKRCAAVRPGVNNIVQLLVGHEDNTPRENESAVRKHLPGQIRALSVTVAACLQKAKDTDRVFGQLLQLTMEVHEACTATQGTNEERIKEANLKKEYLEEERKTTQEVKQMSKDEAERARDNFKNAQDQFNKAANSMPGAWTIAGLGLVDMLTDATSTLTLGLFSRKKGSSSRKIAAPAPNRPPVDPSDIRDPGYQSASMLRTLAELLHTLLTTGTDGRPDWNSIRSDEKGGSKGVRVGLERIVKRVNPQHPYAGQATTDALRFARRGTEYAGKLGSIVPPGNPADIAQLAADVSAWRDEVLAFASEADLKLGSSQTSANAFLPEQDLSGCSSAELAVRSAQYKLAMTHAQLNASREGSKAASEKLMEVTGQLGDIMAQIAKIHVQKQNWEEITQILLKAIGFLCELKKYLNNLVHFFSAVHNLVSVNLHGAAEQFIQIIKESAEIENDPRTGREMQVRSVGGITLDAWARQAIYNHALSAAKISKVVENISDMYVTLYDSSVHPGVNMLLGMGKLIGSKDQKAVIAAGEEIQNWAADASQQIVQLVAERMHVNEQIIQSRITELEKTLGGILPQSSRIDNIVRHAEEDRVQEISRDAEASLDDNMVFRSRPKVKAKAKVFV